MGFRITTNMTMNTYRHNLMNVNTTLAGSRDKVLTHRNFNSFYEDPSGATQAFRLRQAYYEASSQLANNDDTYKRFHSGWLSLGKAVDDLTDKTSRFSTLLAVNGTEGAGRTALGQVIGETAKSVVQMMNCQYGDQFIFSGSDGLRVPFSWSPEGDLLYRGVNVNAGGVKPPEAEDPGWLDHAKANDPNWNDDKEAWYQYYTHATDEKPASTPPSWLADYSQNGNSDGGNTVTELEEAWIKYYNHETDEKPTAEEPKAVAGDDTTFEATKNEYGLYEGVPAKGSAEYEKLSDVNKAWADYYNDQNDYTKLKMMAEEEVNLDLGMGMQEIDGKIVDGSVFNTALPGIKMLGFGVDEDGDPLNIVVLQQRLGEIFKNCGEEDGSFHPPEDEKVALRLMDKLKAAQAKTTSEYVELDTKAKYLQTNSERLSEQKNTLNEQVLDIEQVDLADAISTFSWDLYCYNAALKIGNQLLSQSLIDYMN